MTTNNHTAIVNGASNAAATWNTPLAELDEAIGDVSLVTGLAGTGVAEKLETERAARIAADALYGAARLAADVALDARIDTIIASSGTSSTETVDGRGPYTVLSGRLDDMVLKTNVFYVDANFDGDETTVGRFTTISAALAAASANTTIYIAPGTYSGDLSIADDGVKLIGAGMPQYDDTGVDPTLVGGTIITGLVHCNSRPGIEIRDLGVNVRGLSARNAITASNSSSGNINLHQTFRNLVLLGNGWAAQEHAIENNGGCFVTFDNIRMYWWYHGLAILASHVNVTNLFCYACASDGIIIKSKASAGDAQYINISNVTMTGDTAGPNYEYWTGPIIIESATDGNYTRYINISNVTGYFCINGIVQIKRNNNLGAISDINFSNVWSVGNKDLANVGDFWLRSGTRINFVGCGSVGRVQGYGWEIDTADDVGAIYLIGCSGDGSGAGDVTGEYAYAQINGQFRDDVILQYGISRNAQGQGINGYVAPAGISVTGANVNVAALADANGDQTATYGGYSGLVLVHARHNTSSNSNIASYLLWVHKNGHSAAGTVTTLAATGLTSGAGTSFPSFTWGIDATNHRLQASVIATTTGTFYFSFSAMGNIRVIPI